MVGTRLVGIVNVTRDSFSDGGRYLAAGDAVARARELYGAGADVVELGPASSHPDAEKVLPGEEIARLGPVVDGLGGIPWGVDSYQPETQRWAIQRGASYLNDIQGFPQVYDELVDSSCQLVVMHSVQRTGPATRLRTDPDGIWARIEDFFDERVAVLQTAGIARERLILDPGLGYFLGSTPEPSITVLQDLPRLKERYGVPVLVSPSRKSFLRAITGTELAGIGPATLAAELYAVDQGADYIRTHEPRGLKDALLVSSVLRNEARPRTWGPGPGSHSMTAT